MLKSDRNFSSITNFLLYFQFYLEPPQKLLQEMTKARGNKTDPTIAQRLASERFQCPNHGEVWVVGEQRGESPFMFETNPSPSNL